VNRTLAPGTPLNRRLVCDLALRPPRADHRIEVVEVQRVIEDLDGRVSVVAHDTSTPERRSAITLEYPAGAVPW
jgi:hypothetical protein